MSAVRHNCNVTGQPRAYTPTELVTELVKLLKSIPDSVFPVLPPVAVANTCFADLLSQGHNSSKQPGTSANIDDSAVDNVAQSAGSIGEPGADPCVEDWDNNAVKLNSDDTGTATGSSNNNNELDSAEIEEAMIMDPMGAAIVAVDVSTQLNPQLVEEMGQLISQIRLCFTLVGHQSPQGQGVPEPQLEQEEDRKILSSIIQALYSTDCVYYLIKKLPAFDFERRKLVTQIITALIKRNLVGTIAENIDDLPLSKYCIENHPDIFSICLDGYRGSVPLCYGSILREMVKWETFTSRLLNMCNEEKFCRLFAAMNSCHFDVSSDASLLFKDMMTRHKKLVSEYLKENFETFFAAYECLVLSVNYATRRSSIKLLSEILLSRTNFSVMTRYISKPSHLKLVMCLLKDPSTVIRGEVFHIFKVFVANPKKTPEIIRILAKNKERLIAFLRDFNKDKEDGDLADEKLLLMREISRL